jgi:hypothetical protein
MTGSSEPRTLFDSPFVTKAHDSFSIPLKIIDSKIAANKAKF